MCPWWFIACNPVLPAWGEIAAWQEALPAWDWVPKLPAFLPGWVLVLPVWEEVLPTLGELAACMGLNTCTVCSLPWLGTSIACLGRLALTAWEEELPVFGGELKLAAWGEALIVWGEPLPASEELALAAGGGPPAWQELTLTAEYLNK